jgi:hypothetical protein
MVQLDFGFFSTPAVTCAMQPSQCHRSANNKLFALAHASNLPYGPERLTLGKLSSGFRSSGFRHAMTSVLFVA